MVWKKPVFGDDQRLSFATAARSKSCNSLYVCSISIFPSFTLFWRSKKLGKIFIDVCHISCNFSRQPSLPSECSSPPRYNYKRGSRKPWSIGGGGILVFSYHIVLFFERPWSQLRHQLGFLHAFWNCIEARTRAPPPIWQERAESPSRARRDVDEGIVSLLLLVGSNSLLPLIRVISIKTCCLLYMRSPFVQLLHYFRLSHNLTTLQGVKHILFRSATNLLLKWCKKALTLYAPRPLFKTLEGGYFIKAIISSQNSIRSLGIN